MSYEKIVAVIGATGAQGGGLVRAIVKDPACGFRARAITRNVGSAKAQELAALGVEVVAGDLDDPGSIREAFRGAHYAFCVTNYWEHFSPEREFAQARALADAAAETGLRHVIWSTLEDTRKLVPLDDPRMPTLMGKYKVPHFDAKGAADVLFAERHVPTTYLLTSFYWDNFIHFGMGPTPGPDGTLAITFPLGDAKLPGIAVDDIGRCALGVLRKGQAVVGSRIGIAGEHLTGAAMASAFTEVLGRPVRYQAVPPDVYRSFGFPGADDLGNMFQYKRDFETAFCAARDVAASRALCPGLQDFRTWLQRNAARIPLGGA